MSTSIEININNTCRTCLSQNVHFNSIYETIGSSSITFKDILLELVKTEVDDCHGLPIVICGKCTGLLKNFYSFKIKCEESEKVLLDSMNSLTNDDFHNFGTQANQSGESSPEKNSIASLDLYDIRIVENKYPKVKLATLDSEMNSRELHLLKAKNVKFLNSPSPVTICIEDDDNPGAEEVNIPDSYEINSENDESEENFIILSESNEYLCVPHGLKKIECKICDYRTHKIYELRNHLKQHTHRLKESPENIKLDKVRAVLEDESTGRYTDDNELIDVVYNHLKKQNFSKFYSIRNKFGSEMHINDSETESDEEPNFLARNQYTCEICKQSFDRRYKILYHQSNSHNYEALQHHCPICLMGFCSLPLLTYHQETQCNNRYKKINCDCGMKFQWKENFEFHRHTVHSHKFRKPQNTKEKRFSCDICSKWFFRQEHLDRHMLIHSPDSDKKFECSICYQHFNRQDIMKWHMRTHCAIKEDNKYLCKYCGRKFSSASNWIIHIRRHTGEKPYKCDTCGKGFPRSYDVQAHKRMHTGEKPWICTICGKGFAHSNKLTRHIRVHTGVRPFKCTYCDKSFKQSSGLTVHIRRHTGDRPYVCVACGDKFIHGTALRKHQRSKNHIGRIEPDRKSLRIS